MKTKGRDEEDDAQIQHYRCKQANTKIEEVCVCVCLWLKMIENGQNVHASVQRGSVSCVLCVCVGVYINRWDVQQEKI